MLTMVIRLQKILSNHNLDLKTSIKKVKVWTVVEYSVWNLNTQRKNIWKLDKVSYGEFGDM